MAKLAQTSVKYVINGSFDAEGIVEKPDVIGALFGQTEGLLGAELDLRELQRTGRIGRIEVIVNTKSGKSTGQIVIPSSLDSTETALIAASLETIDRVGPCNAKIKVISVEDLRTVKRKYIIDRAKTLLSSLLSQVPETAVVAEELMQSVRSAEIIKYKGLSAGVDVPTSDSIILCEGRADVITLLKHGIKNAVAVGGTAIAPEIIQISKEKEITVFTDGDRGGDIIIKELKQVVDVDFVARAPLGKEVEELTKKEVFKALREKVPADLAQFLKPLGASRSQNSKMPLRTDRRDTTDKPMRRDTRDSRPQRTGRFERKPTITKKPVISDEDKSFFKEQMNDLVGTRAAAIYDSDKQFAGRVPVKELSTSIKQVESPAIVVMDAELDQDLVNICDLVGVSAIVGTKQKGSVRARNASVLTLDDL
ncbi:MAG: DNA primase [Candidatus Nanohalarchaeota archaeon]|nr:MAG: DNA primase [Candidatus Nanohaloarchaeota archaeon]